MTKNLLAGCVLSIACLFSTVTPALAIDIDPPSVGAISPTTVITGSTTTFSASYNDHTGSGIYQCRLADGQTIIWTSGVFAANSITGTISLTHSLGTGAHYLQFQCQDNAGNWGYGPITTVTATNDTIAPRVGSITPTTAIAESTVTFSASYNDPESGVYQCQLADGGNVIWTSGIFGANSITGTISLAQSLSAGTHYLQFQCRDSAGNWGNGTQTTVTVTTTTHSSIPTVVNPAPTVGPIQQTQAISGVATTLTAAVSGNISECSLLINGTNVGRMSVASGLASMDYILSPSVYAHVECISPNGNIGIGSNVFITTSSQPKATSNLVHGTLIKLICPTYAAADHPCKAVYYFGADGKRHPFPNSKIYFSWFSNFDGIQEISEGQMASAPLGKSVRYRPGVKMVKFTTVPKVYAVAGNGTLRWVTTEALATAFYTSKWNEQIDDIPDTFYANYNFGEDIINISQYNPIGETNMAPSIDSNL